MKHLAFLCVVAAILPLGFIQGQEPAEKELEFVRKLREKYPDLALAKLDELAKNPPPGVGPLLPLEYARTRVALGKNKSPEERLALVGAAEADLKQFIANSAGKPEAALAQLELSRLAVIQGQAWLNRAFREEDVEGRKSLANKASEFLAQGGTALDAAIKTLPADEKLQARFDRGIVFVDQARAKYLIEANAEGAGFLKQARGVFQAINNEDNTTALGMLAGAWLVKCCYEGDEPDTGAAIYKKIMDLTGPEAQAAKRWGRLFKIQSIKGDAKIESPDKKIPNDVYKRSLIRKEAEKWLVDYAKFRDTPEWLEEYAKSRGTPEGHAVLFELAEIISSEGKIALNGKTAQEKERATELFSKAQKYYAVLAATDSDYAERANQMNLTLSFHKLEKMKSFDQLKTFDEWNLKAQFDVRKFREAKEDKERAAQLKSAGRSLRRALALADARTPVSKLSTARFDLLSIYLAGGDFHRAAVVGEGLAREQPPLKHSALGAAYAIDAYFHVLYQRQEDTEANRERLRDLAVYVVEKQQKLWEHEMVMPMARYHLAMLYDRDGKLKEAIAQLEKLPPTFERYQAAQGRIFFLALRGEKDESERKFFEGKARAALARLKLPADPDAETALWYFNAQVQNAHRFLYVDAINHAKNGEMTEASGKLLEMAKLNEQLRAQFKQLESKLPKDAHAPMLESFEKLERMNRYVRAELEYKAGNFAKVLEPKLAGDVIAEVEKKGAKPGPIRIKDYEITAALLGLALRANVQGGNVPKARDILKLLERLAGEEGALGSDTSNVLRMLVAELNLQVKVLKKAGDQEGLKRVVANFSSFLDDYAKNPGSKGLGGNEILFLASCYESLNQPDKAASYYKQFPEPPALKDKINLKDPKLTEAEKKVLEEKEKDIGLYWHARLKLAQQLRLAKEYKEATGVLNHLKGHPNARSTLLADVELNQILEDNNLWGNAINKWGEFMKNPGLMKMAATDNNAKKLYFEGYVHHAYCLYKYGQDDKQKKSGKDKEFLRLAADRLLRLEFSANPEGWNLVRPRVQEILAAEPLLGGQYQTLKPDYEKKKKEKEKKP